MKANFNVFWEKSLGTINKDNCINQGGLIFTTDINIDEVDTGYVNYEINQVPYKDLLIIEYDKLIVPTKNDVLKAGDHRLEIVLVMKNKDVKTSQTYKYTIEESLENEDSLQADTNYPILVQMIEELKKLTESGEVNHSHSNLDILNKITEEKINNWDNKSFSGDYNDLQNKPQIPIVDVNKKYVDDELSKKSEKHSHPYKPDTYSPTWEDVQNKPQKYTPSEHQHDFSHTHNEYSEINHIHSNNDIKDYMTLVPTENGILHLTKDKIQNVSTSFTRIELPSIDNEEYLEIQVYFDYTKETSIEIPHIKYSTDISIILNNSYCMIFTYRGTWLGGIISYE